MSIFLTEFFDLTVYVFHFLIHYGIRLFWPNI